MLDPIPNPWRRLLVGVAVICALWAQRSEGGVSVSGPVRAVSWSDVPADCRMISSMIWVRNNTLPETAAKESLGKPHGLAALILGDMARDFIDHPQDQCRTAEGAPTGFPSPFLDRGVAVLKHRADWFFSRFKAAGGRLDLMILDFEKGFSNWQSSADQIRAIWDDPRSKKWIAQSGIKDINRVIDWRRGTDYLHWNAVMGKRVNQALNRALFDPVGRWYPGVKSSNFGGYIMTEKNVVPDLNGHFQFSLAHGGTHSSPSFYGHIGGLANQRLGGKKAYGQSPFAVLRWHLNTMRAAIRSSNDPMMPWVSNKQYPKSVFRDNPYYEELIYHLALSGADGFLYWNPRYPRKRHQQSTGLTADEQDRIFDSCLRTLNEHLGRKPRQCLTTGPIPWDSRLLATGMLIGDDEVLWRVTVLPGGSNVIVSPESSRIDLNGKIGFWYHSKKESKVRFEVQ